MCNSYFILRSYNKTMLFKIVESFNKLDSKLIYNNNSKLKLKENFDTVTDEDKKEEDINFEVKLKESNLNGKEKLSDKLRNRLKNS